MGFLLCEWSGAASRALLAALSGATLLAGCSLKTTLFTPEDDRPAPTTATITIGRAWAAMGSISAQGVQLSCTDTCTATVAIGTSITLLASPDTGAVFGGWSGDGCAGTDPSCTVAVTQDLALAASFEVAMFTVDVAMIGGGSGNVMSTSGELVCPGACTASVPYNTSLQLIAAPSASSTFLGWSGACAGADACAVTVTGPITVTAMFAENDDLIVMPQGNGTGLITSSPDGISCGATCSARFPPGTMVTLSAAAADDSNFTGWAVAGCEDTTTCQVTMNQATLVVANFALQSRALTITERGNGTVLADQPGTSCGENCIAYDAHTVVTLTASPGDDSEFSGWTGACEGTGSCTVTMDNAVSVTANFTLKQFTLTVVRHGNGTVNSNPGGTACPTDCMKVYPAHTVVTLTAVPGADSVFGGWAGACTTSGLSCMVTIENAATATATFTLKRFTLMVSQPGNGHGTLTFDPPNVTCATGCAEPYDAHTVVTLTATPAADSMFTGWGSPCAGTGGCTVTMESDVSVAANFTLRRFTLDTALAGNGAGTVISNTRSGISCPTVCSEVDDANTVVTLTATPSLGSTFTGWSNACTGTGTCQVTMTAAKSVTATFARHAMLVTVNDATQHLERIDLDTLAVTDIGPLGIPYAFGDCMFNPADSKLYLVDGRRNFSLYTVNITTGLASLVGSHGDTAMEAIAYDPLTNQVYAISITSQLFYSMNTTTGAATMLGHVSTNTAFQGMAWDSKRNQMTTFDGVNAYTVDVSNGVMTKIGTPQSLGNYGVTYDPILDRYWSVDSSGRILQFDPNNGFATTRTAAFPSNQQHTCVAFVPE